MKILLAQIAPVTGDIERNLSTLESIVAKTDAELIIFPELFLSGYIPRDKVSSLAQSIDGSIVSRISDISRESSKAIIVGLPLKHQTLSGGVTNSAIVVNKKGRIGRYDKTYLPTFGPFEESLYFTHGSGVMTMDLSGLSIGVLICYDIFFPELSKLMALRGAELIVCISASPTTTIQNFKRIIPARAIENTTYIAYVNLVGSHLDLVFGGCSRLVDPRGDVVVEAKPLDEDYCIGEIDSAKLEFVRKMRPTLRDSRKDVFEALFEQLKFS